MIGNQQLIYVVDDDDNVRNMVAFCLLREGFNVEAFEDPVLALATFTEADPKPTILLTDYNMPAMDGMELLCRCKAVMPSLKTISISGTLTDEVVDQAVVKPDARLKKPFGYYEFVSVLKTVCSGAE